MCLCPLVDDPVLSGDWVHWRLACSRSGFLRTTVDG